MDACQDADAIKQDPHGGKPGLATLRVLRALNLGCADNDLAGVRRQCFYLALPRWPARMLSPCCPMVHNRDAAEDEEMTRPSRDEGDAKLLVEAIEALRELVSRALERFPIRLTIS